MKYFKILFISTFIILSTNSMASAYTEGNFPGIGSLDKWTEAMKYFEAGNNSQNLQEQINNYKKAIGLYQFDSAFWVKYGKTIDLNKNQDRLNCFLKAIMINPKNDEAYECAGIEYQNLNQFQKSIECFNRAYEINPDNLTYLKEAGESYMQLKDYSNSLKYYLNVFDKTKSDTIASYIGICYSYLNEPQKAIKYLLISYKNLNYDRDINEALALNYLKIGNLKLAQKFINQPTKLVEKPVDLTK